MGFKVEFEEFSCELDDGTTYEQREIFIEYMTGLGHKLKEEKPKGIWFVYGYDTSPYPLYMSDNEDHVNAYMSGEGQCYQPFKVFWPFGMRWGNINWTKREVK